MSIPSYLTGLEGVFCRYLPSLSRQRLTSFYHEILYYVVLIEPTRDLEDISRPKNPFPLLLTKCKGWVEWDRDLFELEYGKFVYQK